MPSNPAPRPAVWLAAALACAGCAPPAADAPPPGLDPLEDNTAALPDSETVALASGTTDDYAWTHARGRVDVALADVSACVAEPEVGVDRRRVADYAVTDGVNADYAVSYDVFTTVEDLVTLTYTLEWLQDDRGDGTWGARGAKIDGSDLLELWEVSVLLQPIDDTATDVGIIEHLGATLTSTDDTEQYTSDFYASILACSHGDALPTYADR